MAHAAHRDDRHARVTRGRPPPHDDARARGASPLADRHVRGASGLAGARYLRALGGNHRGPATRAARPPQRERLTSALVDGPGVDAALVEVLRSDLVRV